MEQNDKIELTGGGLKCDTPGCGWTDPSIKMEDYYKHVNDVCPKCGANVLTQEDFHNFLTLLSIVAKVNSMSDEEIGKLTEGKVKDPNQRVIATIETHKQLRITDIRKADE